MDTLAICSILEYLAFKRSIWSVEDDFGWGLFAEENKSFLRQENGLKIWEIRHRYLFKYQSLALSLFVIYSFLTFL